MSASSMQMNFRESKLFGLIRDIRNGHAWLWNSVWAMLAISVLLTLLGFFDHRLINGVNVWDKPTKFFLAVAIQFATVSWALTMLERKIRGTTVAIYLMVGAGWAETIYIAGRAAVGLTSHFNYSTLFSSVAYGLMGIGALALTGTAFFIGLQIWLQKPRNLWREAAALGLMIGATLGTVAGGYMSTQTGHWVGGEFSDAHGVAFFGWSTTGGDLRVPHFVGLHATQLIPLAALSGDRRVVWATAGALVVITMGIFLMGISGVPLFRA
ncbi:MAG: hypothetical protein ABI230_04315 [Aestuariivirga sp.]